MSNIDSSELKQYIGPTDLATDAGHSLFTTIHLAIISVNVDTY